MVFPLDPDEVRRIVDRALAEDLGERGDITTDTVVPEGRRLSGRVVARDSLVVAGIALARETFARVDPEVAFEAKVEDGMRIERGTDLAVVSGRARSILKAERVVLNFLMRLCGIATAARAAVDEVAGTGAVILDTRKTAPGLRSLDKYAVAAGGATNHRMGLYDAILIKDTHLVAAGSIESAMERVRSSGYPLSLVTVEVESPEQLAQAIRAGAGRALLDNMDLDTLRRCAEMAGDRIVLEASGGLRPGRLRPVAAAGVSYLSVGWLTHSAPAADVALDVQSIE